MKTKRCFMYLAIVLVLVVSNRRVIAFAAETSAVVDEMKSQSVVVPYAEQTTWYFRIVDGRLQKRLWSNTYGKWLTEWEWT